MAAALIRAKCLRIRLVKALFSATQARDGMARHGHRICCVHGHAQGAADTASQASGLNSMSAQRMTLELRKRSAGAGCNRIARRDRIGRQLRLAVGLVLLTIPLSGCGTGALWDKFFAKDDTFVDEPADKLYNEGLYLMNQRSDPKAASGEPETGQDGGKQRSGHFAAESHDISLAKVRKRPGRRPARSCRPPFQYRLRHGCANDGPFQPRPPARRCGRPSGPSAPRG